MIATVEKKIDPPVPPLPDRIFCCRTTLARSWQFLDLSTTGETPEQILARFDRDNPDMFRRILRLHAALPVCTDAMVAKVMRDVYVTGTGLRDDELVSANPLTAKAIRLGFEAALSALGVADE